MLVPLGLHARPPATQAETRKRDKACSVFLPTLLPSFHSKTRDILLQSLVKNEKWVKSFCYFTYPDKFHNPFKKVLDFKQVTYESQTLITPV